MFSKIFIANRGEIACRIVRACSSMGICSVLGFHEVDRLSLGVRLADYAIELDSAPGTSARTAYLDIEQIVAKAVATGSEAVHPGYGFLSENASFAAACGRAGLSFIGPKPEVISLLGDKNKARETMALAGVPLVPGSDGPCANLATALELAEQIGYPVLIKAAAGGGGRGMRRAYSPDELKTGFDQARREALAAFANESVYLEKYVSKPRHVEIQILADNFGRVVHLGERECSIQRRFQKMFEEAPSPYISEETRVAMGEAASRGAVRAGYSGAGTFEFLIDSSVQPDEESKIQPFYFLEVNTRLQVEHPVTEEVSGIDIVEEQIKIASGLPLSLRQEDVKPRGWAIECRITCEDPDRNFAPSVGEVEALRLPSGPGVRIDTHLYEGYRVPNDFDSMLAKLIVTGKDRDMAIRRALAALDEFQLVGFSTSIPFHRWLLKHPRFRARDFSTHFIEEEFQGLPEEQVDGNDLFSLGALVAFRQAQEVGVDEEPKPGSNWGAAARLGATSLPGGGFQR